jgi:hypothetical protein
VARESTTQDAARLDHELAARLQALSHVLTLLDEAITIGAARQQAAARRSPCRVPVDLLEPACPGHTSETGDEARR